MNCPHCGHPKSDIIDTRKKSHLNWRRHRCQLCKKNFHTNEVERTLLLELITNAPVTKLTAPFLDQVKLAMINLGNGGPSRTRPRTPRKREVKSKPERSQGEKKIDRDWFKSDRALEQERKLNANSQD